MLTSMPPLVGNYYNLLSLSSYLYVVFQCSYDLLFHRVLYVNMDYQPGVLYFIYRVSKKMGTCQLGNIIVNSGDKAQIYHWICNCVIYQQISMFKFIVMRSVIMKQWSFARNC